MKHLYKKWVLVSILSINICHAAIVGDVTLNESINDGTAPADCTGSLNVSSGGMPEMALDLDQDGVTDVCFGSGTNSCSANFNFDAYTVNGTLLSTQDDTGATEIMGGSTILLSDWIGSSVGPNFQSTSGDTNSAYIGQTDVALVFGFSGGSNTATTEIGYFSFTIDSSDCSVTFGKVDYETSSNTYSGSVAASSAPASPLEW